MINPEWDREFNIATVSLEMAELEMQMEWNNGNLPREERGRPLQSGEEVRDNGAELVEGQRPPQPDAGGDDQYPEN
jgi:hypothetical protein